jgi:serine/threonine protein kinase
LGFFFFREMKMYTTDVWGNTNTYLVYEHAENGSLTDWLHDNKYPGSSPLAWKQRVQIAYNVADALNCLHNYTNPPYIHKNLKTSNILLDSSFRAKISNIGLARTLDNQDKGGPEVQLTRLMVGTHGYVERSGGVKLGFLKIMPACLACGESVRISQ